MTEQEFLKNYDSSKYEKPSVTADMLVFSISPNGKLEILLIKRKGYPYKDKWAIPGGFINIDESVEQAAKRELAEETGLTNIHMEQFYTFSKVDRDPRMRVISVANIAFVPRTQLEVKAGDDASDAKLFEIRTRTDGIYLYCRSENFELSISDLAFDHKEIFEKGLDALKQKLTNSEIVFEFVEDKDAFTIYEVQIIYEAVFGEKYDVANFRRVFKRKFEDTGFVGLTGQKSKAFSKCPSKTYCLLKKEEE